MQAFLSHISQVMHRHYMQACMAELQALKPGNVHLFADGHQMTVQDFIQSATVSSPIMSDATLSVGERILGSIKATHTAVNCNTNLGIILLLSPVIEAVFNLYHTGQHHVSAAQQNAIPTIHLSQLKVELAQVLTKLTIADGQAAADAIQIAKPAGLGQASLHDVHAPVTVTLYTLMQAAESRDMIAYQYTHAFATILDVGLTIYQQALQQYQNTAYATTALYLKLLTTYADSHVSRKYGQPLANALMQEGQPFCDAFWQADNPKLQFKALLDWDAELKGRYINPGTTADLTVAVLFVASVLGLELPATKGVIVKSP